MVSLTAASLARARDLIAFEKGKMAVVGEKIPVTVIAKLDDRAIGVFGDGKLESLLKIDKTAEFLQTSTDIARLWVANSEDDSPDYSGMLYRTDNFQLLDLDFTLAQMVMADGVRLSKCQDINLPADPMFFVPARLPSPISVTAEVDSLMALVSVDSVESYIQRMEDYRTRYTCTDSFWTSGDWIASKFQDWGYSDIQFEEFDTTVWCTSRNVIAVKEGEVYPDRCIVVGGHYDSVVYDGGDANVYAPGADDNATGTAMAMECARVLADTPFRKTVRFIAFGAEEQGLVGAWVHAISSFLRGDNIELMMNADMIGNVDDSYLNFNVRCNEGGYAYGRVMAELAEAYTDAIPQVIVGHFGGSDHYPFDQIGYRTTYTDEGDFSPNWHRQTDTIDNIDIAYTTDIIRANLGLLFLAQQVPVPVTGLMGYNSGDGHTVYLEWDPSPDIDVIGYEVYVGTSEDGLAIYDTAYAAADTVYNLTEEQDYYFGIASLTADGGRSFIEEFVQVTPRSIPQSPSSLSVSPIWEGIRVDWEAQPDMDFDFYQVYRKEGANGVYQPHGQSTNDSFTDNNLQSNVYYFYKVTQVDTTGLESDYSPEDYGKMISLDSGILLVDETRDTGGGQGSPTDAEQDSFYQFISEGYTVEFYDVAHDGMLRINDIGGYSTIAWLDDDATSNYLADVDPVLADYLDFGGNLLFAGWRSFADYNMNRPYDFNTGTFPRDYLDILRINSTNLPDFQAADGIDLWPSAMVDSMHVIPQWHGLLIGIDVMTLGDAANAIYTYDSASGDTLFQGKPVGLTVDNGEYRAVYLTFPLYPMGDLSAREIFTNAMSFLGEQVTEIPEFEGSPELPTAFLSQNYPNPFNNETRIKFLLTEPTKVHLAVYNILGQEIAVLADGEYLAGTHYVGWSGIGMPSGVYFYRLNIQGKSVSRRMTLVR